MVIIELIYKKSLDEVNHHLEAHRAFLDKYYTLGLFLASGPKQPRDGGVILALTDKEHAAQIIQEDPFNQQAIADYRILEFTPTKHQDDFARWVSSN